MIWSLEYDMVIGIIYPHFQDEAFQNLCRLCSVWDFKCYESNMEKYLEKDLAIRFMRYNLSEPSYSVYDILHSKINFTITSLIIIMFMICQGHILGNNLYILKY